MKSRLAVSQNGRLTFKLHELVMIAVVAALIQSIEYL